MLAVLGLLAVCAWLGSIGKNNKMFYVPMVFMLVVTVSSLVQTIMAKMGAAKAGVDPLWSYIQSGIGVLLIILVIALAVTSFKTLKKGKTAA